jgi:hypothetical protein
MTEGMRGVNAKVKRRLLLGHRRSSVIFANGSEDFREVYEWGVRNSNGTEAARKAMRKRLEDMSVVVRLKAPHWTGYSPEASRD